MRRTLIVFAGFALAGTWLSATVVADGQPTHPSGATLVDRLDEFGRRLFEGVLPTERKQSPQMPTSRVPRQQFSRGRVTSPSREPRAGTAVGSQTPAGSAAANVGRTIPSEDTAKPWPGSAASRAATDPTAQSTSQRPKPADSGGTAEPAGRPASTGSNATRLHERLRSFGQSAFPQLTAPASQRAATSTVTPPAQSASPGQSAASASPTPTSAPPTPSGDTEPPAVARRPLLGRRFGSRPASNHPMPFATRAQPSGLAPTLADPLPDEPADTSPSEGEVATESPSGSRAADADDSPAEVSPRDDSPAQDSPADEPGAGAAPTAVPASSPAQTASRSAEPRATNTLLFRRQSPILDVKTTGPRRITVGKPSTYEVTVHNSSQVAADQLVVTIGLPPWTEVLETEVSEGAITAPPADAEGAELQWALGRLEGASEEKLSLGLVARQRRPFDLAVRWGHTPSGSQALIEVQEPKLQMRLEGPREVLYGQSETYRLHVANSGNGDAENVEISLVPMGTGESVSATHKLGTLKAGDQKTIEVELTARQTGPLTIQVDARADAAVTATLTEKVAVSRPALKLDLEAPALQYVGADVAYQIRVSNPGTAPARNVALTATMPPGVKYVSSTEGGELSPDRKTVTWTLECLDVGTDRTLTVTGNLVEAGASRLEVAASAAGDLSASDDAVVHVEAIADLALEVTDPAGPVPVGTEATYQVRVANRGTKGARDVEVVAYFSDGIEPTSAHGGRHETAPGQVLFDKIPSLAAGADATFRIKAKAQMPGNHVCRVEVYCKPLGTRLVSEETTYFYGSATAANDDLSPAAPADDPAGADQAVRTAGQRPAAAAE